MVLGGADDLDVTAGVAVLCGVGQEVRQDLRQTYRICLEYDRVGGQLHGQMMILAVQGRTRCLHRGIDDIKQHDGFLFEI